MTRAAGTASPLRSRNNVFVGDRIETAEDSCVRLLLGGKAVLTVTDRSVVTIGEQPGVAIIDLGTGTIALSVARERLKAGDAIELRTPDAVAQIRGTILVAEVSANAGAAAGAPGRAASRFTALTGVVDVIPLDAARQRTSALTLPAVQTLAVRQGAPPDPPRALTPLEARSLFSSLRLRATPSPVPSYTAPPIPASTDWTLLIDRGRGFDAWRAPAAEGNVAGDDMLGGMTLASCEALAAALAGQGSRAACARSPWNYLEHPRPARHRDANDQLMATGPLAGKVAVYEPGTEAAGWTLVPGTGGGAWIARWKLDQRAVHSSQPMELSTCYETSLRLREERGKPTACVRLPPRRAAGAATDYRDARGRLMVEGPFAGDIIVHDPAPPPTSQ